MYPNNIRERIANNELLLSSAMFSRESHIAAAIFQTGADWTWIDQEHAPWGPESMGMIAIMARQHGVVRVPWNTPGDIKKAYDVGAVGVMVPQVDNPDEVREAIKHAKYPPLGARGIAPWFAATMELTGQDIIDNANKETILCLQMESVEAYERLDETLAIKDFEVAGSGSCRSISVPGCTWTARSPQGRKDHVGRRAKDQRHRKSPVQHIRRPCGGASLDF
jgi:4-hydroxy-2-oxoheptanedioate aldolase